MLHLIECGAFFPAGIQSCSCAFMIMEFRKAVGIVVYCHVVLVQDHNIRVKGVDFGKIPKINQNLGSKGTTSNHKSG